MKRITNDRIEYALLSLGYGPDFTRAIVRDNALRLTRKRWTCIEFLTALGVEPKGDVGKKAETLLCQYFSIPKYEGTRNMVEAATNEATNEETTSTANKSKRERKPREAGPRGRARKTLELICQPEGITVPELRDAFEDAFGDGKLTTARQAINKVPKKYNAVVSKVKEDGRGLVYRATNVEYLQTVLQPTSDGDELQAG